MPRVVKRSASQAVKTGRSRRDAPLPEFVPPQLSRPVPFGSSVIKSPKGWGIGLHRYELHPRPYWMDDAAAVAVPASHQDQVVTLRSDARVIARSDFTPYAGLDYGDAISFQFHPEFSPAFATALIEASRDRYEALATSAIQCHLQPDDCARVGRWIGRFLDSGRRLVDNQQ